ncbi:hypothetical protein B0H17DRAFT_563713 [Mycena rosella]|uniref:Secreted protein n=1 Tax=Mycena rosella TaxID=1033263 RepID=A0AAD7FIV8_MYCRO|nr:hypothetical protein B0H17DRAFT_563713 [Mycena rosella]
MRPGSGWSAPPFCRSVLLIAGGLRSSLGQGSFDLVLFFISTGYSQRFDKESPVADGFATRKRRPCTRMVRVLTRYTDLLEIFRRTSPVRLGAEPLHCFPVLF